MNNIILNSEQIQKCRNDFKNFLYVVFKYINLPSPTEIQYAIADELQYRESDLIINGFRGVAKSTITGCYNAWLLDRDPENTQIIYIGANQEEAKKFMKFTRGLLERVPFLNYLLPDSKAGQRDNALAFDVRPSGMKIQPSCKALSIFGNLTGNRATHIIADDIETSENCDTQIKREHIESAVTEFRQIVSPLDGSLLFLGTPHTEISIYNKLYKKGIKTRIFPIKFPDTKQLEKYGDKISPYILNKVMKNPDLVGTSTDIKRFSSSMILKLEAEGKSKFAMQQMLDTSVSDTERYPLKCSDLIVAELERNAAYEKVEYDFLNVLRDIPCNGIGTDRFYGAKYPSDVKKLPYGYKIMAIDPSGRGEDELAYVILGVLNAQIFLLKEGGMQDGYCESNLITLAKMASEYNVNKIKTESNFGDGMFTSLFMPILKRYHSCALEEVKHNVQKEKRIIDTLEPVMNQHRLIVDKNVIYDDAQSVLIYPLSKQQGYSLFYQLTRITKEKNSLVHDDRVDCLAMAVSDCLDMMKADRDEEIQRRMDDEIDEEFERMENFYGRTTKKSGGWLDI